MGLLSIFRRKKKEEEIMPPAETYTPPSLGTESQDMFQSNFSQPQQGITDRDVELILTKLDLINKKLDSMERRLQYIERVAKESK